MLTAVKNYKGNQFFILGQKAFFKLSSSVTKILLWSYELFLQINMNPTIQMLKEMQVPPNKTKEFSVIDEKAAAWRL